MKRLHAIVFVLSILFLAQTVYAQEPGPARAMAATVMTVWPAEGAQTPRWSYEQGVVWRGMEELWYNTGDANYYKYIQQWMDRLVDKEGNIATYKLEDYNLDNVLCGRLLLMLYRVSGLPQYQKAAATLYRQLQEQRRTEEGSFWHKKKYQRQVWLDGLYMAQPFNAEYAALFHKDTIFGDIARQFISIEKHARDPKTGLLYHGYDESRQEKWASKTTGNSPNFWARAMGWYGMALVDVLDAWPAGDPGRLKIVDILKRYAVAVAKVQDPATGCWWDVLDKPGAPGNYPEASASAMFVYTLAKAVRKGWLPAASLAVARKGWKGVLGKFVFTDAAGQIGLHGTVGVSGLGGDPYRDGSYEYYTKEKVVDNDPKGIGAFLLAAGEMEVLPERALGKGKKVMLDYYFNSEHHKDITGTDVRFHYTWEDQANSGYSLLGHLFRQYGLRTDSLPVAPTARNLAGAAIYIIVDPDNEKESPRPNFFTPADSKVIFDWVSAGGTLVLMGNDSANCEFEHFNQMAGQFGIHFNWDCYNKVQGTHWEQAALNISADDAIFRTARKVYIKELSTLRLYPPAKAHYTDKGNVIMAVAKVGKGTVFVVGDPWFYNEYLDGRRLPAEYENYKAATDLVKWLAGQAH